MAVMSKLTAAEKAQRKIVRNLVLKAQQGDRLALGSLFARYHRLVLRIAREMLRDEDEAQELAQDVFLKVIKKLPQLRKPECFVTWLTRIAERTTLNRITRRSRMLAIEPATLEVTCTHEDTPFAAALQRERVEWIRRSMNSLSELDRRTLLAHYLEFASVQEMADSLNVPVGTIKRRLHDARLRLKERVTAQAGSDETCLAALGT